MNRALRFVTIMDLRLPGDFKARLASEGVRQLADSGDILQPPAIRKADSSVIFGGDRLAAQHLRGAQQAEVWVVDCTEDEAEEMRLVENLHRRAENKDHLKTALLRLAERRVAARLASEQQLPPTAGDNAAPRKPGRPKTEKGIAREEAAVAAGTTPEAIRKAEQRSEAATCGDVHPGADVFHPEGHAPPVAPPPGADIAEKLDAIDRLLVQATGLVTKLAKEHPELVERFQVQGLKFALQREVAPGFRAMRPFRICAYCKEVPSELPLCGACKGSGWMTADQLRDIPVELLVGGERAGIFMDGKFVTLAQLAAAAERKAKKAPAKKVDVRLVDEAGHEEPWTDTWTEES